jgi:4-amino-4-deoxy-L-arabinose transferase-like glycosyltransferase
MSARAQSRPAAAIRVMPGDRLLRLEASAWGAVGVVAAFIAITCWWLTQDRSVPIYDAGEHLIAVFTYRDLLLSGNLLGPFNQVTPYPPLAHLVGVLGTFVGGENVAAPIITENLVFGSLLALGCYQIGALLFDSRAGLLAVMFAFASPLLIAQLHVFMLDAPETALVAVSIWLILASERFSRVGMAALAGLVVGLGRVVKVQFPLLVIGVLGSALVNGGWRNKRGLATFAAVAFVIGSPWYINHLADLGLIFQLAGGADSVGHAVHLPSTVSTYNLTWYLWTILDAQLFMPLFLLTVSGAGWTTVTLWRDFKQRDRVGDWRGLGAALHEAQRRDRCVGAAR